jgi:hypothetical protein
MYKKVLNLIFLFLFSIPFVGIQAAPSSHGDKLRKKYPYMLLSNDYGILNENDMAINTCVASSAPFSENNISSFYWRCFDTKNITALCEKGEYDPSEGIVRSDGSVTVQDGANTHIYFFRQRIDFQLCEDEIITIKSILRKEKYVCLSGQFSGYGNPTLPDDKNSHFINWTYDKLKTKRGCTTYFGGECRIKYWQEDGCEAIVNKYGKISGNKTKLREQLGNTTYKASWEFDPQ